MAVLNAILPIAPHAESMVDAVMRINRISCGVRARAKTVNGIRWPFLEGGKGETVVLLHGFGATKDHMVSLARGLCRSYHVVIPDLPGYGEHAMDWSSRYDARGLTQRLEQLLDALGIRRVHLLGVSLGGYVAATFAAHRPMQTATLTLIDSAGFDSPVQSNAMALFQEKGHNIFLYTNHFEFRQFMTFLVHDAPEMPERLMRHWAEMGIARLDWRRKLFQDLVDGGLDRLNSAATRIDAPTLVLWGTQDRICHVSAVATILERIADCRAYLFDPCGHLPMIEYPDICRQLFHQFLACRSTPAFPKP